MSASLREKVLLDRFWRLVGDEQDRLALLRRYASVLVERPAGWDFLAVRADHEALHIPHTDRCWVCLSGDRKTYWHHVIQIQNGGSNHVLNYVPVCHECHKRVHPWLTAGTTLERRRGFVAVRDLAWLVMTKLADRWDSLWKRVS